MKQIINQYSEIYKRDIRLDNPTSIRRLLARVTNLRLNEKIDSQTCKDVVSLSSVLLEAYRVEEQQQDSQGVDLKENVGG